MLNLPVPPRTRISRYLECISCRELFVIAEDSPFDSRNSPHWQSPSNHYSDTQLRYQPYRYFQPVNPDTRAIPHQYMEYHRRDEMEWEHINCPRCGTDNRNWLHILETTPRWWRQFFPEVVIGFIFIAILIIIAFNRQFDIDKLRPSIFLLLTVALAGGIPIHTITRNWRQLREYNSSRNFVTSHSFWQQIPPPLTTWLLSTSFFLLIFPFLMYILIPWGFTRGFELIKPSETANIETTVEHRLDEIQDPLILLLAETPHPQNSLDQPAANESTWLTVDKEFLNDWFLLVLLSSIVGIVFGWLPASNYVRRINRNLPRPIYQSIAKMTRVVVWEAGAALEIEDEIHYMQWTNVRRNNLGGIDLEGLYRDIKTTDQEIQSPHVRVRAQRYEIKTDRWGRIQSARITSVRVPTRPQPPEPAEEIGSAFFRHLTNKTLPIVPNQPD